MSNKPEVGYPPSSFETPQPRFSYFQFRDIHVAGLPDFPYENSYIFLNIEINSQPQWLEKCSVLRQQPGKV